MYYVNLRHGKALSEVRRDRAEAKREQAVVAVEKRRLRHRLGKRLVALGERLERKEQVHVA